MLVFVVLGCRHNRIVLYSVDVHVNACWMCFTGKYLQGHVLSSLALLVIRTLC